MLLLHGRKRNAGQGTHLEVILKRCMQVFIVHVAAQCVCRSVLNQALELCATEVLRQLRKACDIYILREESILVHL